MATPIISIPAITKAKAPIILDDIIAAAAVLAIFIPARLINNIAFIKSKHAVKANTILLKVVAKVFSIPRQLIEVNTCNASSPTLIMARDVIKDAHKSKDDVITARFIAANAAINNPVIIVTDVPNMRVKFAALINAKASMIAKAALKSAGSIRVDSLNIVLIVSMVFANDMPTIIAVASNTAVIAAAVRAKVADIPASCASKLALRLFAEAVTA